MTTPQNAKPAAIYLPGFDLSLTAISQLATQPTGENPLADNGQINNPELVDEKNWGQTDSAAIIMRFDHDIPERVSVRAALARIVC